MRALRQRPAVAITAALVVLAAIAGPVRAGPASWLTAIPTVSPIAVAAGGSATVTITNTDRRASSSALVVTLARNPTTAPFAIGDDTCNGLILRPGRACTVEVTYEGTRPTTDHVAALTVSSGKPMKGSVTRVFEVGVSFADVCIARGGSAGQGGTITVFSTAFSVGDRCDWGSTLPTAVYNAAFEALSPECFDLHYQGTVGYPVTGETGRTAIGCVVD